MQKGKENREFTYFVILVAFIILLNVEQPPNNYQTCFTPPHNQCGSFVVNHINQAQKSIYVQAYGFTHPDIIHSLIEAKKRNVNVEIILDSSNFSKKKLPLIQELEEAGIKIYKAKVSGIAHNKIMIFDNQKVLTGSFNFTKSADTRNAENIIVVRDKKLVKKYLENWKK